MMTLKYFLKPTEGPALHQFWDFKKTVVRKICINGTVGGPLLMRKSPMSNKDTQENSKRYLEKDCSFKN